MIKGCERDGFLVQFVGERGQLLASTIAVTVPPGLNRHQAILYCAGLIAAEAARYAVGEALGTDEARFGTPRDGEKS